MYNANCFNIKTLEFSHKVSSRVSMILTMNSDISLNINMILVLDVQSAFCEVRAGRLGTRASFVRLL
jgi:hypothetical protein